MEKLRSGSLGVIVLAALLGTAWVPAAHADEYAVSVTGLGFEPQEVTMNVGDMAIWTNSDGMHNVVADDGSFMSGPPSSDQWEFSHTFHYGGVYTYHCEEHPTTETGTITVEGVFGDPFESGDTDAWSASTEPNLPNCNCYFSGDCVAPNGFCDWGVLTNEDTCIWRQNKPDGVPGAGCDVAYVGTWIAGICDGACAPSFAGSSLGREDQALIEAGIRLWAEALLRPAEAGGGPVDPDFAAKALALSFESPLAAWNLGRQVADLLAVAGVSEFADHFCHYEGHPEEVDPSLHPNLLDDPCRRFAARSAVAALLAELKAPGSSTKIISGLRSSCSDWREMFGPRCTGSTAIACLERRIADLAVFITTSRNSGPSLQEILGIPKWIESP